MVLAGIIAYIAVALFMILWYRLPGFVAAICLAGHVGLMLAAITGFFSPIPSFTLTLPGIAGIILSIGMGVDANVINAERIKEEIRGGKTIDGALEIGYKRAFTAIFDGNITVIIVAVILMGAFGPPASTFSRLLSPVFFMFGPATTGTIYSFGFTLLVGVVANFIMGILASRLMVKSIAKFKPFRKAWMFGGAK
jgi:preprotein translocase subunit SecD